MSLFWIRPCWIQLIGTFSIMLLASGRPGLDRVLARWTGSGSCFLPSRLSSSFNDDEFTDSFHLGLQLGGSGLIVVPSALTWPQGEPSPSTFTYFLPQIGQRRRGGGERE